MMALSLQKRTDFKNIITCPIFYLLKFATMNGQTWKNMKKISNFPSLPHQIS